MEFFLCVIGTVLIIEGLPYFAIPDKMKYFLMKMLEIPEADLRGVGLVMILAGILLLYLGRG